MVLFYGIAGYFVPAIVRIGFSVYQVLAVLFTIIAVFVLDILIARGAESRGEIRWGRMPPRSQYALFVLWSPSPGSWVSWASPGAGSGSTGTSMRLCRTRVHTQRRPALGYAAQIISASVVIFFLMIAFVFWIGGMIAKPALVPAAAEAAVAEPIPAGGSPGGSGADRGAGLEPGLEPLPGT